MLSIPINLDVLMHVYLSRERHPRYNAPAVHDAHEFLRRNGMILKDGGDYRVTEKGVFFIEHLMSIPFPEITYKIPAGV